MTPTGFILKMCLNMSHKWSHRRCFWRVLVSQGCDHKLVQYDRNTPCHTSGQESTVNHCSAGPPELLRQDASSSQPPVLPAALALLGLLMCLSMSPQCLSVAFSLPVHVSHISASLPYENTSQWVYLAHPRSKISFLKLHNSILPTETPFPIKDILIELET